MSYHTTKTGHVKLVCEWGHGTPAPANLHRPATIITDDGDGHFHLWKFTGKMRDALAELAGREPLRDGCVIVQDGASYSVETEPADFMVEDEEGNLHPDLDKYPNILAWA